MEEIKIINDMLTRNAFDKGKLLSIIESFDGDVALIPLLLLKDQKIIRTRINTDDLFYKVSDLNYPPASCVKRTDRASLQGHPMFYGSVFTKEAEKTGCLPRIVSALETIDVLKACHTTQHATFTQSVWFVENGIHAFAFPVSDKYKRRCSELDMFMEGWEQHCKQNFSEKSIEFFSFIGDLMATPQSSCIYDITATCVDYILKEFAFEGVVYPSVPSEGEGLNICLTPATVDSKVSFGSAVTEIVFRKDMESSIISFAHSRFVDNETFVWVVSEEGKPILKMTGQYPDFKPTDEVILCPEMGLT